MKFEVQWLFLSESVVYFVTSFLPILLLSFSKDHNKECSLKKVEQFSKCSFGEICSQRLTTFPFIWN